MTEGRHRFVFPEKVPRKFTRVLVHAKCVQIKQTAEDHKRVEFLGASIFHRQIDIKFFAFICVIPSP